jgi:hypothetical protein
MTSEWLPLLQLFHGTVCGGQGAYMIGWPDRFVGTGRFDASDPRTVRFFGGALLFFGLVLFSLALWRILELFS